MATSAFHVFNQYYWDLIKKTKDFAKVKRSDDDDEVADAAHLIYREIKKSYLSFDKLSEEYVQWYREHAKPITTDEAWQEDEALMKSELYKGIRVADIAEVFANPELLSHYLLLLSLFADDTLTNEEVSGIIRWLQDADSSSAGGEEGSSDVSVTVEGEEQTTGIDAITKNENAASILRVLSKYKEKQGSGKGKGESGSDGSAGAGEGTAEMLQQLENTSLGKLAKEIMSEIDVDQIQNSVADGDIWKAISKPESGLGNIIGKVTQKMASKMASGELRQDSLLQDASQLLKLLPGMTGNSPGLGNMTSMMQQMGGLFSSLGLDGGAGAGASGTNGTPDFGAMMNQMMGMMGGGGSGGMGGINPQRRGSDTRAVVNRAAIGRHDKARELRRKLEQRRAEKSKENMEPQVGEQ